MTPDVFDTVRVDIVAGQYVFRATGSHLKFPGFYAVWLREDEEKTLPVLSQTAVLDLHKLTPEQHVTQPPSLYIEQALTKSFESQGLDRPRTHEQSFPPTNVI